MFLMFFSLSSSPGECSKGGLTSKGVAVRQGKYDEVHVCLPRNEQGRRFIRDAFVSHNRGLTKSQKTPAEKLNWFVIRPPL